jgi:hypothetical protein
VTPAEQRDRLIAAIEDHRNTQGDEAGCQTTGETELWLVLEQVKAELRGTPSIFGRERWHVDTLAQALHAAARKRHDYSPVRATPRGATFDLDVRDSDREPVGLVRVTIELV